MDRFLPLQSMTLDKPLLGVWAVVTCLAGGAATQQNAGAPLAIDHVGFAPGWEAGAPAHPALALAAIPRPAAPAPALPAIGSARIETPAVAGFAPSPVSRIDLLSTSTAPIDLVEPAAAVVAPTLVPEPLRIEPGTAAALVEPNAVADLAKMTGTGIPAPAITTPEAPPAALPGLVNQPEFRSFNLAKVTGSRGPGTTELVPSRARPKPLAKAAAGTAPVKDLVLDESLIHVTGVSLGGQPAGTIDVRIGADMKPSVKVGDLLALVSSQMDPDTYARLSAASGSGDYVNFATLRAAGFDVSYSAGSDSINISVGN
jgi:hypothetical protein